MKAIDLTFPTPEENLACDEALLDLCEEDPAQEVLRFWEPAQHFVVLGYSNPHRSAVHLPGCRRHRVPILRRCSGGGTVLQGPGCLNYTIVLRIRDPGPLDSITGTNRHVLERHCAALGQLLGLPVQIQGDTDLALEGRKFSGNSQRRRRHSLLFHGTLLLSLDLELMQELLPVPARQPSYRKQRPHAAFLTRLPADPPRLKRALTGAWGATIGSPQLPAGRIQELVRNRYCRRDWNFRY